MGKYVQRYIMGDQIGLAQVFVIIFFVIFILLLVSVYLQPKKILDENSKLPFENNDEIKD